MFDKEARSELLRLFGAAVRFNEPLVGHTTMGVGGAADAFIKVEDEGSLGRLLGFCGARGIPVFVIGSGSNVIARDGGWRGVVFALGGPHFGRIRLRGEVVEAGAGASLGELVEASVRWSLSGLEPLSGIPGTVGGAVRMNAGAHGASIGDFVKTVRLMHGGGRIMILRGTEMGFSYRGCRAAEGAVILDVTLRLSPGDGAEIGVRARRYMEERAERLPQEPSAGSVFKNPDGGPAAGVLIERAGMKGAREGGAAVHGLHANVIVNMGGARARDVLLLMEKVRRRVSDVTGIELEPEVVIIGEEL